MDKDLAGIAAQQMMCGLSDNPMQYREPPLSAISQQCWDAKYGQGDSGPDYLQIPF